jgi:bleomycin hydrolase
MRNFSKYAILMLAFGCFSILAQGQSYYDLKPVKQIKTSPTKDLQRYGSCWSNAGTALLEAEWMRAGKPAIDLSEMNFIRNAYLLKADAYFKSNGEMRVDEKLLAYDVIPLMTTYGIVPEEMFMKSPETTPDSRSGEMDAILRGTLQMSMQQDGGNFTEKWKNTFDAALSRYLGEPRYRFNFDNTEYDPKSFAQASGISASDFILITSDNRSEMDKKMKLPARSNWNNTQAYNVSTVNLQKALQSAVNSGFTVVWYGSLDADMIYADEMVAFVPAREISELTKTEEGVEPEWEPLPEKAVTDADRQTKYEASAGTELDHLLIFGISKDKNGTEYIMAKKVCEAGNQTLHLSPTFIKLNTGYLMLNKNGLPKELKSKFGI